MIHIKNGSFALFKNFLIPTLTSYICIPAKLILSFHIKNLASYYAILKTFQLTSRQFLKFHDIPNLKMMALISMTFHVFSITHANNQFRFQFDY